MTLGHRNWLIQGELLNADGSVFNRGRILVYHLFPLSGFRPIAESNINSQTGHFELRFETGNFQEEGSPEINDPIFQIRVTDFNYNLFWTSKIYTNAPIEISLGTIFVDENVNENWTVCGNVYVTSKTPFTNGCVKVFDVRGKKEIELGSCLLNAAGFYSHHSICQFHC